MQHRMQSENNNSNELCINYALGQNEADFDIFDVNGNLVQSGKLKNNSTSVVFEDSGNDCYIVLVQDGNKIYTNRFFTKRA
jgi:hypothetical protein